VLKLSKKYLKMQNIDFSIENVIELQKLIKYHSDLYYNKENPIISDVEYDELLDKLSILENKYDIKNKQSVSIWSEILESTFNKVKHSRPMISLGNTYNEDDLNDFDTRINKLTDDNFKKVYTLEFKFDGLWVELIYKQWRLIQAITRWNGIEGEDVTVNVMQITNIPKTINYKKDLEIRGEVVMPISVFNELNRKAKIEWTKVFSNPRNSASWSLRMKDASITKQRKLKFFAYDLANFDEFRINENITEYYDVIIDLKNLWFDISSYFEKYKWIWELIKAINNFWDTKKLIDFEIDWLVLKVNNISLWQDIWFTEHHPRYAIAYKFPAEVFTTQILSVEHSVWRTWTITPVANLEAINIAWVIVKRATLHNYEEVENLDARIGDTIFIKRAWEVIPKIISVVKDGDRSAYEKILPPKFCPSCETVVKKDDNKVRYYCPNNIDCPAKHHEKLSFAVWKQWFNIDWFWEKQVETFLKEWIIHNLADIFKISEKKEEILDLEWFQEKSVNNLVIWVEKAKNVEISVLLTALWISGVGKKTARTISKFFKNKDDLLNFNDNIEDLENLEDIWPEIAKNVIDYFWWDAHLRILWELVEILNINYYKEKIVVGNSIFNWKNVCITGSFIENWNKIARDELVELLEEVWWEFISTVSKNTDYLLAWEKAWSKKLKAEKIWIEIINLTFFKNSL